MKFGWLLGALLYLFAPTGEARAPEDAWEFDQNNLPGRPVWRSPDKRLAFPVMAVEEGQYFFYRWGAKRGFGVVTVKNVLGLTGVWFVRMPRGKLVTMQMNARSAVSTHALGGVSYERHPKYGGAMRRTAIAEADRLLLKGVSGAQYGPYKGSKFAATWTETAMGFASVVMMVPTGMQGLWIWGIQSWWHMPMVGWLAYSTYYLGNRTLQLSPVKRVVGTVTSWIGVVRDAGRESFAKMEQVRESFDGVAESINDYFSWVGDDAVTGYMVFVGSLAHQGPPGGRRPGHARVACRYTCQRRVLIKYEHESIKEGRRARARPREARGHDSRGRLTEPRATGMEEERKQERPPDDFEPQPRAQLFRAMGSALCFRKASKSSARTFMRSAKWAISVGATKNFSCSRSVPNRISCSSKTEALLLHRLISAGGCGFQGEGVSRRHVPRVLRRHDRARVLLVVQEITNVQPSEVHPVLRPLATLAMVLHPEVLVGRVHRLHPVRRPACRRHPLQDQLLGPPRRDSGASEAGVPTRHGDLFAQPHRLQDRAVPHSCGVDVESDDTGLSSMLSAKDLSRFVSATSSMKNCPPVLVVWTAFLPPPSSVPFSTAICPRYWPTWAIRQFPPGPAAARTPAWKPGAAALAPGAGGAAAGGAAAAPTPAAPPAGPAPPPASPAPPAPGGGPPPPNGAATIAPAAAGRAGIGIPQRIRPPSPTGMVATRKFRMSAGVKRGTILLHLNFGASLSRRQTPSCSGGWNPPARPRLREQIEPGDILHVTHHVYRGRNRVGDTALPGHPGHCFGPQLHQDPVLGIQWGWLGSGRRSGRGGCPGHLRLVDLPAPTFLGRSRDEGDLACHLDLFEVVRGIQ